MATTMTTASALTTVPRRDATRARAGTMMTRTMTRANARPKTTTTRARRATTVASAGEVSFSDGRGKSGRAYASISERNARLGKGFDGAAAAKYVAATAFEAGAIAACLSAVQKYALSGLHASNLGLAKTIVAVMFFALSFRSRVFSPLNASRPRVANEKLAKKQKKRPSWTPPAVVFPLVWISMGFLRSLSTMLVFAATGTVTHPAILAFVAHLSIGDTWNSINNVEKRLGVAAVGVLFVVSSAYNVVYQYYNVLPTAGYVIAPLAIWLTVATTLVWGIWNINLPREPLYPTKPSVLVA